MNFITLIITLHMTPADCLLKFVPIPLFVTVFALWLAWNQQSHLSWHQFLLHRIISQTKNCLLLLWKWNAKHGKQETEIKPEERKTRISQINTNRSTEMFSLEMPTCFIYRMNLYFGLFVHLIYSQILYSFASFGLKRPTMVLQANPNRYPPIKWNCSIALDISVHVFALLCHGIFPFTFIQFNSSFQLNKSWIHFKLDCFWM